MNAVSGTGDPPPIHICLRPSLDWHDETAVEARIIPGFRRKFEMWNATFTMPYHVFRQRLTAIAERSLQQIADVNRTSVTEVPAGHLVVPVDDDDWFAPELGRVLRAAYSPDATGYLWDRATLQPRSLLAGLRRLIARTAGRADRHICKTNNYAMRFDPELARVPMNHVRASEYFDARPETLRRIRATLGVQNRSLASQTTLAWGRPVIERVELLGLYRKYRRLYGGWRASAGLEWAAPYVHQMGELMSELDVR